jgi:hypothetical protein
MMELAAAAEELQPARPLFLLGAFLLCLRERMLCTRCLPAWYVAPGNPAWYAAPGMIGRGNAI